MIPLHTQKTLDQLTWNEIQKLHSSLKLKATATTRTRRDYQNRIVAAQPQPVVEPEAIVTPLTCATCPLARQIEDNRYCCGLTNTVVRGHWEAKSDCYDAVADAQPEVKIAKPVTETEALITPQENITQVQPELKTYIQKIKTRLTNHPFRYCYDTHQGKHSFSSSMYGLCECTKCLPSQSIEPETAATAQAPHAKVAEESLMDSIAVKENEIDQNFNNLACLSELEMKAQLAIEKTIVGSENEAVALLHLKKIERDIEFYDKPKEVQKLQTSPVSLDTEGTIHWQGFLQGTITGKKGVKRSFFLRKRNCLVGINLNDEASYEIMLIISANFTAAEYKHPNKRHQQIRDAINVITKLK